MNPSKGKPVNQNPAIWRQAIDSVFGAARRLHQYRDARDVLLRQIIQEQERQIRRRECCDERPL